MTKEKTLKDCTLCGLCKSNCPVFRSTKLETKGARARAILIKENIFDDILKANNMNKKENCLDVCGKPGTSGIHGFDDIILQCTLCASCKIECPQNIDLPKEIRKARQKLIESGKETPANKIMIENIRIYGNPFGKQQPGKIPKELYCC